MATKKILVDLDINGDLKAEDAEFSGNVGIGTTSPNRKLHVIGQIAIDNSTSPSGGLLVSPDGNSNKVYSRTGNATSSAHPLDFISGSSNSMRIDTTGNVGIGTTSPNSKLEVDGVITIAPSSSNVAELKGLYGTSFLSMDFMLFDNKLFGNAIVQNQMMQTMVFNDGSGEGMRLSQGKLGIGTTSPTAKLEVDGSFKSQAFFVDSSSGTLTFMGSPIMFGSVAPNEIPVQGFMGVSGSGIHNNNGNIGIGTTNAQHKLDVKGSINIEDSANSVAELKGFGLELLSFNMMTQDRRLFGGLIIANPMTATMKFDAGFGEAMRINGSTGQVGIGTTAPRAKLDVAGGIKMANDSSTATAANVGTMRYRVVNTRSYMDMCMQVGTSSYAWVNIKMNQW